MKFAYITGWRVKSEVLTREWRHVDLKAGEVRLEPGTTKNKEGRTFPFTSELRTLIAGGIIVAVQVARIPMSSTGAWTGFTDLLSSLAR